MSGGRGFSPRPSNRTLSAMTLSFLHIIRIVVRHAPALSLYALIVVAAPATADHKPRSIAGQLLVATEAMPDPRFAETVIYMVEHDSEGALGLIVNRVMREVPVADILDGFGIDGSEATGSIRVHAGGPVMPANGFALHNGDYEAAGTVTVTAKTAFTPGIQALLDGTEGKGPAKLMFALGVSSWGPGQLERELGSGSWVVVPADDGFLFGADDDAKWARALRRRGIDL